MKRILVTPEAEKEIEVTAGARPVVELETGTALVMDGARVHRVTRAGGRLLVNGKEVTAELADPRNRRRGGSQGADTGRRDVKAAMPGKVIKILVSVDEAVEPGAGLLILEAMKMQNEVRAVGTGRVTAIRVAVGETVASGQVLVTLE